MPKWLSWTELFESNEPCFHCLIIVKGSEMVLMSHFTRVLHQKLLQDCLGISSETERFAQNQNTVHKDNEFILHFSNTGETVTKIMTQQKWTCVRTKSVQISKLNTLWPQNTRRSKDTPKKRIIWSVWFKNLKTRGGNT